ncbi:MAG TPA: ABC transporter permease [Gaiellales bacterium]
MATYIWRRLLSAAFVAVGVTVATFVLLHLEPGDPARLVLGEHASASAVGALNHQWGLDSSLPSQFRRYVTSLAHGDLGQSYINHTSAVSLIGQRIGVTFALVGIATLFTVVITLPVASLAASRKDRLPDHVIRGASVAGLGLPAFWFGIVLIEIFALQLHVLPVGGFGGSVWHRLESLILPGFTAAIAIVPILVRSLRVGMVEVLDADFVANLRAKGLGESRVLMVHVARNAVIPTLTLLGVNIAYLIGSTVVVERVFGLNGLGSLLLTSITDRDFPVVQAVTLLFATSVVLVNLATDLLAAWLDPRIRLR